jgi:uncharacterized MAPEG superfamily protein
LKIRNSGVYRLLLFALCVFAFSQLLPSVRTLQHVIVYGELQPRDFFTSPYGMGGRVTDDVQNLAYTYVQEEMAFLNPNFVYEITGKRGRFTNEKQGVDIFATYPYSVKIEGDTVRYGAAFPNDADLYLAAEELPDMSIGWTEDAVHNVRVRYNTIQNELQRSPYMAALFVYAPYFQRIGQIMQHAAFQHIGFLHHQRHLLCMRAVSLLPVKLYRALIAIIQPGNQMQKRGLPAAVFSDNTQKCPRRYHQFGKTQDFRFAVALSDISTFDLHTKALPESGIKES